MGFRDGSGISWTTRKQSAPCSRQVTTPTPNHSLSTGRMLFLMPKQQCQALNAVPLITDKYVTVQMNTAGAVKLGRVQIILLIIGRQAIVVINNSKRFTYSPAPCSDSHQQKLINTSNMWQKIFQSLLTKSEYWCCWQHSRKTFWP